MNDDRQTAAKRGSDATRASKRAKPDAPARKTRTIESGATANSEQVNGEGAQAPRKRAAVNAASLKSPVKTASESKAATARRPRKAASAPPVSSEESDADVGYAATARELSPEERHRMIERIAYFRAEWRGWTPGAEMDDWLHAEREVDDMLRGAHG